MRNHKETIQRAEGERRHGEEVHRRNGFTVIAAKRRPSFRRLRVPRRLSHPTQHDSLGNLEAKHPEFAMNARRSPSWILGDHAEDQLSQFPARRLPSNYGMFTRDPFPVQLGSGAMPPNDSLRLRDREGGVPAAPNPAQDDPKQLVGCGRPRTGMLAHQSGELLPKCQVFHTKIAAGRRNFC